MNQEDKVRAALKALAEYDRPRESSRPAPRLHARRPVSRWKTGTAYALGALAAAAAVLVLVRPSEQVLAPRQTLPTEAVAVSEPSSDAQPVAVPSEPKPDSRPERIGRRETAAPALLTSAESEPELATDFFPLTDSPIPFEHGQLVRVVVPAATMQRVGLPVRPERWSDRVTADVLVGDEGMPRAIRFVSFQQ